MKLLLVVLSIASTYGLDCSRHGENHPVGSSWTIRKGGLCQTFRCRRTSQYSVTSEFVSADCEIDGECVPAGRVKIRGNCRKTRCEQKGHGHYSLKTTLRGCVDYYGVCREIGSRGFSAVVRGNLYDECSCSRVGSSGIQTSCVSRYPGTGHPEPFEGEIYEI